MKRKYLMTAFVCSVCLAFSGFAGAVCAEETEGVTEASAAGEAGTEAENTETEALPERPDYRALDYVTLGDYTGLNVVLEPEDLQVTEEEIQEEIRANLQAADKLEEVPGAQVQDGDTANIDFEGKLDGEPFEGGTSEGYDLEIGSGSFIDGFEDGLIGVTVGQTVDLPLTFPENYGNAELAGKDVIFTVTVNSVKRVPELTDALANEVSGGEYADAPSYHEHIAQQLQEDKEANRENMINNELMTLIVNNSTVNDYPQELVDYSAANMKSFYQQYADMYGMEYAEFLESFLGMTEDQFNEEVDAAVRRNLMQEMYLKAIAEAEEIGLTDEEYAAGCEEYAQQYGYESGEDLVAAYGEDTVRLSLIQDKVIGFVRDNAVIETQTESESETGEETPGTEDTTE